MVILWDVNANAVEVKSNGTDGSGDRAHFG